MKNIVFFSDGTWNEPDVQRTSVFLLFEAARSAGAADQVAGYDPGLGTGGWLKRYVQGSTGIGISQNVRDAYRFVVEHYEEGDRIFLCGFSRGAYTARSAAGMIRNSGVLRPRFRDKLDEAFQLYRDRGERTHPDSALARAFRHSYGHGDTPVHCVAVFDTVGALGIPGTLGTLATKRLWQFHDVQLSRRVRHAFHALALDERRVAFQPTLWYAPEKREDGTSFEQRWFSGAHGDLGGALEPRGLSSVPLAWMAERLAACGLRLERGELQLKVDLAQRIDESQNAGYRALGIGERVLQWFGANPGLQLTAGGDLIRSACSGSGFAGTLDESIELKQKLDPTYQPPNAKLAACPIPSGL